MYIHKYTASIRRGAACCTPTVRGRCTLAQHLRNGPLVIASCAPPGVISTSERRYHVPLVRQPRHRWLSSTIGRAPTIAAQGGVGPLRALRQHRSHVEALLDSPVRP